MKKERRKTIFAHLRPVASVKLIDEKTSIKLRLDPIVINSNRNNIFKNQIITK